MSKKAEQEAEEEWGRICKRREWGDSDQIEHLMGFLRERALVQAFSEYAEAVSQEEEEAQVRAATIIEDEDDPLDADDPLDMDDPRDPNERDSR